MQRLSGSTTGPRLAVERGQMELSLESSVLGTQNIVVRAQAKDLHRRHCTGVRRQQRGLHSPTTLQSPLLQGRPTGRCARRLQIQVGNLVLVKFCRDAEADRRAQGMSCMQVASPVAPSEPELSSSSSSNGSASSHNRRTGPAQIVPQM